MSTIHWDLGHKPQQTEWSSISTATPCDPKFAPKAIHMSSLVEYQEAHS
jgi:hypothetical protein